MGKLPRVLSRISSESRSPRFLALKLISHIRGLIFGEASRRLLFKMIIKKNAGKSMRLITKYQFLSLSLEMIKTTFGFTLREWKDPRVDFVKGR